MQSVLAILEYGLSFLIFILVLIIPFIHFSGTALFPRTIVNTNEF